VKDCPLCTGSLLTVNRNGSGYVNTYDVMWIYTNFNRRLTGLDGYPAAKLCGNLDAHGYDDWFLPSTREFGLIGMDLHEACMDRGRCGAGIQFDEYYHVAGFHGIVSDSIIPGLPGSLFGSNVTDERPVRCVRQEEM
jgi:hypothetical protein